MDISNLLKNLGKGKTPLGMVVFLSVILIGRGSFVGSFYPSAATPGIFGGPAQRFTDENTIVPAAVESRESPTVGVLGGPQIPTPQSVADKTLSLPASVRTKEYVSGGTGNPSSVVVYKAERGDTLSSIASDFGVSAQALLSGNPQLKKHRLSVGQELYILPVPGVAYRTQSGDSLDSLSLGFHVSMPEITQANPFVNFNALNPGTLLVIPGAPSHSSVQLALTDTDTLLRIPGYFAMPAQGFDWGQLHNYNAVDIANSCGTAVAAAAGGIVVPDEKIGDGADGWNSGYGRFVLLEHANGTRTRYAHLEKVLVAVGDIVEKGQSLGTMGKTGDATGCHLHFEVYGAQNPFAKQ